MKLVNCIWHLERNDAEYYDEQISKFEENSDDNTDIMKQQVCVITTTYGTFNDTLADIEHNDMQVRQGLSDIQVYLDTLSSETARKLSIFEAKLIIDKHITQVNNTLAILQRNTDVVLVFSMPNQEAYNHRLCHINYFWNP